ncbi:hypothetical protein GCM10020366_11300 [Saccharopolyspora gregorii]|uniref:Uncharacterized protein n=1 Tax=Saccharopolyspora gregorii TaxID=33914 RepID=A0ABP6RIR4_9PSEU
MALDPYGRAEQIDLGSEVFRRQFSYSMPYVHWSLILLEMGHLRLREFAWSEWV